MTREEEVYFAFGAAYTILSRHKIFNDQTFREALLECAASILNKMDKLAMTAREDQLVSKCIQLALKLDKSL